MIGVAVRALNLAVKQYPSLAPDILESWELMRDEIADGGSEDSEAEHFMSWLDQKILEHTNE